MKVLFSAVEKDKVLCNHQTCSLLVKNSWITVFLGKSTCILGFEVDQRGWVDQSRYIRKKKWFSGDLWFVFSKKFHRSIFVLTLLLGSFCFWNRIRIARESDKAFTIITVHEDGVNSASDQSNYRVLYHDYWRNWDWVKVGKGSVYWCREAYWWM